MRVLRWIHPTVAATDVDRIAITHGDTVGGLEVPMNLLDKIRALFGGSKAPQHTSKQQDADREDADRALEAMTRRR